MQKILHSIPATGELLGGSGRNTVYELVNADELELVKLGRRSFITDESIRALVERKKLEAKNRDRLSDTCADSALKARQKKHRESGRA